MCMYVCDGNNHCIRVFDMDLNFIKSIGSYGKGGSEFDSPEDIKFDTSGNMYVADLDNYRVQVLDSSGHFVQVFGEGQGEPHHVASLHIIEYIMCMPLLLIIVHKSSGEFVMMRRRVYFSRYYIPLVLMGLCMCVTFLSSGIYFEILYIYTLHAHAQRDGVSICLTHIFMIFSDAVSLNVER